MRERVASTGSLGSVSSSKTFLSSFVCPYVRLFAVHDPSVHDPFFVVFELVQSRHYTARRDRGVDRSTDRSINHVEAKQTGGGYRRDG